MHKKSKNNVLEDYQKIISDTEKILVGYPIDHIDHKKNTDMINKLKERLKKNEPKST